MSYKLRDDYAAVHARRFEKSAEWVGGACPANGSIYELGADAPFTAILTGKRPDISVTPSKGDLRVNSGLPADSFDGALCMEVMEHILPIEPKGGYLTEWSDNGVDAMMREVHRVLKPNGFLFLTTPNAISFNAIHKVMGRQPPMIYRPHVREYTPYEVTQAGLRNGFRVERFETIEIWDNCMTNQTRRSIRRFVEQTNPGLEDRWEDIFVVFRKK